MKNKNYIQRTKQVVLADGSTKRLKGYGKTEKEALMELAKKISLYEQGKLFVCKSTPFKQWAEEWLETYKAPQVKPQTLKENRKKLELYFYPKIGNIPIDKLTTTHIQKCLNEMEGLSASYISKTAQLIKAIMNQALINDYVIKNVALGVKPPKGKPKQERRALTDAERTLFLQACNESPKGYIYLLSYYCGLRPAEVRALRWQNINLTKGAITVTNSLDRITHELIPPKSKAGNRTIPIPTELKKVIAKLPVSFDKSYFVITNTPKPCTEQNYVRGFADIKRRMDLLNGAETYRNEIIKPTIDYSISPYYLRHTYCTRLAENGIALKTAQYLMGHSTMELTANIYTHVTEQLLEKDLEKIIAL
ncbi:MAG: tyrosine-type recombinase/integrase [Bacillota bacterium]|jgi:integrase